MVNQVCFHCLKRIEDPLDYNMMPLDNPYVNLFFHKSCFRTVGGYGNMALYLPQNVEKVYNWVISKNKEGKTTENGRKTREKTTVQSATS